MFHLFEKKTKQSNPKFSLIQLAELQECKQYPVNTSIFAFPELSCTNMISARTALLEGASPKYVSRIINEYRKKRISERKYEELLQKVINMIDLSWLTTTYRVPSLTENETKGSLDDVLYGVTLGDIAGSQFEFSQDLELRKTLTLENAISHKSMYTDDTVLTLGTLKGIEKALSNEKGLKLEEKEPEFGEYSDTSTYPFIDNPFAIEYKELGCKYRNCGFGSGFVYWSTIDSLKPYGSYGNGSAMRVAPIGAYPAFTIDDVITYAAASAAATHNHPEGVKGAIVTAVCVWMLLHGYNKKQVFDYMKKHYRYNEYNKYEFHDFNMEEINGLAEKGKSNASCMFSVPAAVICFYYSDDYEGTIRNALSFNGDSDTIGAIAGAFAGAYYGVPNKYRELACRYTLPELADRLLHPKD